MTEVTKTQSSQITEESARSGIKSKARQTLDVVSYLIDNKLERPMEITVSGSLIHVTGSEIQIVETDGVSGVDNQGTQNTYKIGAPVLDGRYNQFVDSYLNWATGDVSGSFETPVVAPPAVVSGEQVYMGIQGISTGYLQLVWGVCSGTPDINTVAWSDDALKLGFVKFTVNSTGSGWGRFASPTNSVVTNLPMGGGAGGGGDSSFKIKSIVGSTCTVAKGSLRLTNGDYLVTGSGTTSLTVQVDISINLNTILGTSPANSTTYYLYIDRENLPAEYTLTDDGRKVIRVYDNTHFKLLTTPPNTTNPYRYLFVGYIHTADSGNSWDGAGSFKGTAPSKLYNLLNEALLVPEYQSIEITTGVSATNYPHGLSDTPQIVLCSYFDGTILRPELVENCLYSKDATNVKIVSDHLIFGTSGQFLQVDCFYLPSRGKNILANQGRYESAWLTDTSVSALTHGLTDAEDIKGVSVIEWDTVSGRYYSRAITELVSAWDDDYIYLDWTGLSPSASNRFKVATGASPLPASIPTYIGGFTKLVGFGPGSYPTLSAALAEAAAGDSILVNKSETVTSTFTITLSDIKIQFMPGVKFTFTAGSKGFDLQGNRIELDGCWVVAQYSGTMTTAIDVQGTECYVTKAKVETNHASMTVTNGFRTPAGSARNYVNGVVYTTLGSITNNWVDAGTANSLDVRP